MQTTATYQLITSNIKQKSNIITINNRLEGS